MDDLIKSFGDIIKSLPTGIAVVLILIVICLYLFKDAIINSFKGFKLSILLTPWFMAKEKHTIPVITQKHYDDLNAHDLFNVIEDVRRDVKFHVFPDDPNKTKIFHEFMEIMLNAIKVNLKKLIIQIAVMNKDGKEAPRDELKYQIMKTLGLLVETYCKDAERHLIDRKLSHDDAEYVVRLFEEWRSQTRDSINQRVNAIFASEFYSNNFSRTLAVYELISVSVSLIPKDGIRSFESMNGHFKRIKYM